MQIFYQVIYYTNQLNLLVLLQCIDSYVSITTKEQVFDFGILKIMLRIKLRFTSDNFGSPQHTGESTCTQCQKTPLSFEFNLNVIDSCFRLSASQGANLHCNLKMFIGQEEKQASRNVEQNKI